MSYYKKQLLNYNGCSYLCKIIKMTLVKWTIRCKTTCFNCTYRRIARFLIQIQAFFFSLSFTIVNVMNSFCTTNRVVRCCCIPYLSLSTILVSLYERFASINLSNIMKRGRETKKKKKQKSIVSHAHRNLIDTIEM